MKKSLFTIILLFFLSGGAQAQSGYFGSRYSIDAHLNLGPSFRRTSSLSGEGDAAVYSRRLRIFNPSCRFGFSFIASSKVEVGAAFEYARVRSYSQNVLVFPSSTSSISDLLLEDIFFNRFGISLKTLIYVKGTKAPMGKYFGFTTNFGVATTAQDEITRGDIGFITGQSGFYTKKNEVFSSVVDSLNSLNTTGYYFNFRGAFGRNYAISKKLIFNLAVSFPIVSFFFDDIGSVPNFGLFYAFDPLDPDISDVLDDENIRLEEGDVWQLMSYSLHKYNRVQIDFGIKYNL